MQHHGLTHLILTSIILSVIILATIVGNIFVIAAISLERNLHHIGNYLIASLAVADLMVATLVMPLAAVNEVRDVYSSTLYYLWEMQIFAIISQCNVFYLFTSRCNSLILVMLDYISCHVISIIFTPSYSVDLRGYALYFPCIVGYCTDYYRANLPAFEAHAVKNFYLFLLKTSSKSNMLE